MEPWQAVTVPAGMAHRIRAEMRAVNLCFKQLAAETVLLDKIHERADDPLAERLMFLSLTRSNGGTIQ